MTLSTLVNGAEHLHTIDSQGRLADAYLQLRGESHRWSVDILQLTVCCMVKTRHKTGSVEPAFLLILLVKTVISNNY